MAQMITSFREEYAWASNMYTGQPIHLGNLTFTCVEAMFQGFKDLTRIGDFQNISGVTAKQLGKQVTLRPDWEQVKIPIMVMCIRCKFTQDLHLKKKLMDTQDAILVEGNDWHDNTWGKCACQACSNIQGQNYLGRILMKVRKELLQDQGSLNTDVKEIPEFNMTTSYIQKVSIDDLGFCVLHGAHITATKISQFTYNTVTKIYTEMVLDYSCKSCGASLTPMKYTEDCLCDACKGRVN